MAEDGLPAPEPWAVLANRARDRAEVDAHVGAWTARHDRGGLIDICERFQVPCGPVYAIDEIFEEPQYQAPGTIAFVHDDRAGEVATPNVVPRLTPTPGRTTTHDPRLSSPNHASLPSTPTP